jgi:hypothetical protein
VSDVRSLLEDETAQAWKRAADVLDVFVIAPFVMPGVDQRATCIAFLPHFGGPHGMVIEGFAPPDYSQNPSVAKFAAEWGLYRTAINLGLYRTYDGDRFREALRDWGFFGPAERRPSWLDPGPRTEHGPRTKD